jgi:ElaB/YqjD/DUF883 family membrane-anchored ribosome-binding protein
MSDTTEMLKSTSDAVRDKADEATASARSRAMNALDQANETLRSAAQSGADALEAGRRAAERVRDSTVSTTASLSETFEAAIERQPLMAVAIAAAAGFLVGMSLRRR